jgi:hypothetical protein
MRKINLIDYINNNGKENCLFVVPMSLDNVIQMVDCVIDESRYKINKGYKITLKPLNNLYYSETFYISDLELIIYHKTVLLKNLNELKWKML